MFLLQSILWETFVAWICLPWHPTTRSAINMCRRRGSVIKLYWRGVFTRVWFSHRWYKQMKSPFFCCCKDYKRSFKPKHVKQQHDDAFGSALFYWFVSNYEYKEVLHKEKNIIIECNACFEKSMRRHIFFFIFK